MTEPHLRPLTADETALLERATLGNLNWCGSRFTLADVQERPEFAHYARLVPERGDFGVAAESAAGVVGVAWAVFLPATDPGYGYVDDATPELSLWVAEGSRRAGLGRALLRTLVDQAAAGGVARLSLSVEADNGARRLYLAERFADVPGRAEDGVMTLDLA